MSGILIAGLLLVAAVVVWAALQTLGAQKRSAAIKTEDLPEEMAIPLAAHYVLLESSAS